MEMNNFFSAFAFLFRIKKQKENSCLKVPEGWRIVKDVDLIDIDVSLIKIHIPKSYSNYSKAYDIFDQVIGEYQLGLKSLNYLFQNQSMILEECKSKTTLFLGTVFADNENRIWVPRLYHLSFQNEWRTSFFCLSVDKISSKGDIVLLADYSSN